MTRLSARYRHFFAKGKQFQHFWAGAVPSSPGAAVGATLTVTVTVNAGGVSGNASGVTLGVLPSLIEGHASITTPGQTLTVVLSGGAGAASGQASASGDLLTVTRTLIAGSSSIDGLAPLQTRLNAEYRHFGFRRQAWRHFWAQYEGTNADIITGPLVIVLSLLVIGEAASEANVEGVELTVDWSVLEGAAIGQANASGDTMQVDASVVDGAITTDASVEGALLTVTTDVLVGTYVPGANLRVDASIIEGTAEGTIHGDTVAVQASLIAGETAVTLDGQTLEVQASLIDGEALTTPPDGFAMGATMVVTFELDPGHAIGVDGSVNYEAVGATKIIIVDLIPGTATIGNFAANGDLLRVTVSLLPGTISNGDQDVTGKTLPVQVSLVEGAASGQIAGDTIVVDASIIEGSATVGITGTLTSVQVSIIPGVPFGGTVDDAFVTGTLTSVQVSIIAGVATGGVNEVRIDRSFSGSVRTERARPQDARAHGAVVSIGSSLLTGRVTVSNPVIELVSVGKAEAFYRAPPVLRVLPDEIVLDATASGMIIERRATLLSGGVAGSATAQGETLDEILGIDDDELMEDLLW